MFILSNPDMLRIMTRETKSKFQLAIGVYFFIAFVVSVVEKFTEGEEKENETSCE